MKGVRQVMLVVTLYCMVNLLGVSFADTEAVVIDTSIPENLEMVQQMTEEEVVEEEVITDNEDITPVVYNADGHELVASYDDQLPKGLEKNLKYNKYLVGKDYVVMVNGPVNIRKGPSTSYGILRKGYTYEKFKLIETVKGQYYGSYGTNDWHKIMYYSHGEERYGYVFGSIVAVRHYRFDNAYEKILEMDEMVHGENIAHINNLRSYKGYAPLYQGKYSEDDRQVLRYQSAPGYFEASTESGFRYLQDGRLLRVDGYDDDFYHVTTFDTKEQYYVPKKYVSFDQQLVNLTQIIVVDLSNQNEIVFEKEEDQWNLVSYSYATSGTSTEHKEPTDPGVYKAIMKKDQFLYLDDETKEIAGYAPYAIRFNGGAFIHGFPVNYKLVKEEVVLQEEVLDEEGNIIQEKVTTEKIIDRIDPGHIEYSATLGTIPLSHKCIRNITSHGKFLYEWIRIGEAVVIIEE